LVESAEPAGNRASGLSEDLATAERCRNISDKAGRGRAFTIVELLVVISILSLLMAILVPALHVVKRRADGLLGMHNQRETTNALNLYAMDNDDRYPPSVATVGFEDSWRWYDPTKLIGTRKRTPTMHRAMSSYLGSYLADAKTVFCPSAPQEYKYLQEAWDAGDEWDNPETPVPSDPVTGTFCFYWSYIGYLGENRLFRGPSGPAAGGYQSTLLLTDYFGYGSWRSYDTFGDAAFTSCERLAGATVLPELDLNAALWAEEGDPEEAMPDVKLRAAYVDGHVSTYSAGDAVPMRVGLEPDGAPPYTDGFGSPGIFYIPQNAAGY